MQVNTPYFVIFINAVAAFLYLIGLLPRVTSEVLVHTHSVLEKTSMVETARSLIARVSMLLLQLVEERGRVIWVLLLVLNLGSIPLAWQLAPIAANESGEAFTLTSALLVGIIAPLHAGLNVVLVSLFGLILKEASKWPLLVVPVVPVVFLVGAIVVTAVILSVFVWIASAVLFLFFGVDLMAWWGVGFAQQFMTQLTITLVVVLTVSSMLIVAVPVLILKAMSFFQKPTAKIMKYMLIEKMGSRTQVLSGILYAIGNIMALLVIFL